MANQYCFVDGKMQKRMGVTNDPDWFKSKAEARAAAGSAPKPAVVPEVPASAAAPEGGPEAPPAAPAGVDYESWKWPLLRDELKTRTGKGPQPGMKKIMLIERLRQLDVSGWTVPGAPPDPSAPPPPTDWRTTEAAAARAGTAK